MATPLTQTTGRRKEAVARARLRPGTGQLTINGRAFEVYFPTASQRMAVSEPLRVADRLESFDIDASIHGGGVSGQAGALRMAIARSLVETDPDVPPGAQEGRAAHPRLASQGEQEVRPQEGPQGAAVHQALIGPRPDLPGKGRRRMRFGTDGVRGVANTELTPSFALDLGRAAARVLGATCAVVGGDTAGRPRCSRLHSSPVWRRRVWRCTDSAWRRRPRSPITRRARRHRGGGVGLAQPVRGQRHQALLAERDQAARRGRGADRSRAVEVGTAHRRARRDRRLVGDPRSSGLRPARRRLDRGTFDSAG